MPNPLQHLGSNSVATVKEMSGGGGGGGGETFFNGPEKSQRILYQVREILNPISKSVKSQAIIVIMILFLAIATPRFGKGFPCWQR